jgi:hypothetical protein
MSRNALDHAWIERHHRAALFEAEWTLSGFLGAPIGTVSGVT